MKDVWDVFTKYITGEENSQGVKINKTPWNDDMLNNETGLIAEHLAKVQGDLLNMTVSSELKTFAAFMETASEHCK